jgi:hypothetical protein
MEDLPQQQLLSFQLLSFQLLSFHHFFLVQPATDAALGR